MLSTIISHSNLFCFLIISQKYEFTQKLALQITFSVINDYYLSAVRERQKYLLICEYNCRYLITATWSMNILVIRRASCLLEQNVSVKHGGIVRNTNDCVALFFLITNFSFRNFREWIRVYLACVTRSCYGISFLFRRMFNPAENLRDFIVSDMIIQDAFAIHDS